MKLRQRDELGRVVRKFVKSKVRNAGAGFCAVAAFLMPGHGAFAQSSEPPETGATGEGVVVTGRATAVDDRSALKISAPLSDAPQSISVVLQDQLILQNPQSISGVIDYASGVTANQYGYDPRFPRFKIRGFGELFNGVYQDGLKLSGSDEVSPLMEPYGLQQLDIIRGPTSVLYGQNAPGGMINLVSKQPSDTPAGELELQVGNYGRYDGRWDFNAPLTSDGSLAGRLVGVERESGTQFINVPDDETYVAPSLTWTPRPGTSLTLLTSFERVSGGDSDNVYEARILPKGYPQTVYIGEKAFDRSVQETYALGYLFREDLGRGFSLNQAFRYSHAHVDYQYPLIIGFSSATTVAREAISEKENLEAVTLDTSVTGKVSTGVLTHTLVFGVDLQNTPFGVVERYGRAPALNYFSPVYGLPISAPTTIASSTRQTIAQEGLYGQDLIKIADHWILTGSLREDWAQTRTTTLAGVNYFGGAARSRSTDDALSGRVGLVYLAPLGLAPYVSYSTSFQPQVGATYGGVAFLPTTARQYEVGLRYEPASKILSLTASLYDLTANNVLATDPILTHVGYEVETGQERSRGLEVELKAHPLTGLSLSAAYTYDDVRITKTTTVADLNNQPQNTPANQASVFADYTFSWSMLRGVGFGAGVRYAGPSYDSDDNADGFRNVSQTYIDGVVHYDFGRWRMAINATNLGDKLVPVCFSGACNFSQRRTVIGSVALRF